MRSIKAIEQYVAEIRTAIREAQIYGDEADAELLYEELDELLEELHLAKTATI